MQRSILGLVLGLLFVAACGGSEPPPKYAPDRTAPGVTRSTEIASCKWVPPLPEDREDPCTHDNDGASLDLTQRTDMRAESVSHESHTCVCD